MKHKINNICIFILLLVIVLPNQIFAINSSGGYEIESYNIDMKVNEDNTFDITEIIAVNFTSSGKHGIFRKIPLRNTVERLDGTKSNNIAKITNISVSDEFKTSNDSGYKVIKMGNDKKTVIGRKTYTIKYTYNIGKDPLKNADELYFNLIGTEWDTSINKVNFTITMPKSFDKTKLGFSTGYRYSANSSNVTYNVIGNTIEGSVKEKLHKSQGVTVRLTLPEGYFVGASNNFDYMMLIQVLQIVVSIIFVIIAYKLWRKYGRDDMVVETVEFYPPNDLNSAEIGFLYKGYSDEKDIISLLIYLANKGYLKIEEYEETKLQIIKSKDFKIVKVKDYDGVNEDERDFFYGLFMEKDEVTKNDLYNKFYLTIKRIKKNINRVENQEEIFEPSSLLMRLFLIMMIFIVFLFMGGINLFKNGGFTEIVTVLIVMLGAPLILLLKIRNIWTIILALLAFTITPFIYYATYSINFVLESICIVFLIVFLAIMNKRTQYGNEMLGKIRGFKNFIEIAEKTQLEHLVEENPEYFYNILPYTYVLGISDKWIKKFEDIAIEAPTWYYGRSKFNRHEFNRFMNYTYSSISNVMSSNQSSSGNGGGFSGGGSGGGGGGSW